MLRGCTSTQQLDFPDNTNTSMRYTVYEMMQASLAVAWMYIHTTARLACTNIPIRYTVYEMMLLMVDW